MLVELTNTTTLEINDNSKQIRKENSEKEDTNT